MKENKSEKRKTPIQKWTSYLSVTLYHPTDDQSMLVSMDKPEDDAQKRGAEEDSSRESEETEQESPKRNQIAEEEKRDEDKDPNSHISSSINPEQKRESQEEAAKRDEEKQEEKKHSSLEKEKENEPAHHKDGNDECNMWRAICATFWVYLLKALFIMIWYNKKYSDSKLGVRTYYRPDGASALGPLKFRDLLLRSLWWLDTWKQATADVQLVDE